MKSRVHWFVAAALAALFVVPSAARAGELNELGAALSQLHQSVAAGQAAQVIAARARLASLQAAEPGSATLSYWLAYADWRTAPLLMTRKGDKKAAKQRCQAGIDAATTALELDPRLAEAYALRAGLLGYSIGLGNPALGMTLGPRIAADENKARELAPDNPRVILVEGIGTLHKPGFVGGGADKALARLKEAIARFEAETVTDPLAPSWGRDDAYIWAARASTRLKDHRGAHAYLLKALEINPDHGWARHVLLPAAEKALASAGKAGS
jgi:tetratricopeptide (TPR) repeat protein